ncbi:hypothetical protein MBAV_001910 [Candidatus Magnetobacterium bavaricum]|uniref:Uncharacterized protein n=1 Tax=Candidatus Magnetobacterium bavaricum TaxID=29290 RepID=A0A0F3GVH3_9BACT|nr:hypothetical protein MBAV_001910 [Candidatus Magnetobacterium bavaricum]
MGVYLVGVDDRGVVNGLFDSTFGYFVEPDPVYLRQGSCFCLSGDNFRDVPCYSLPFAVGVGGKV